jgi:hypothetical protein
MRAASVSRLAATQTNGGVIPRADVRVAEPSLGCPWARLIGAFWCQRILLGTNNLDYSVVVNGWVRSMTHGAPKRPNHLRQWSAMAAAMSVSSWSAFAQTTTSMPGMASPLGTTSSYSPTENTPTGVPFGATEIDPGGLSPATPTNCAAVTSSGLAGTAGTSPTMGTSSTFDAAGLTTTGSTGSIGSAASGAGCTSSANVSPNGTASVLSTEGTTSTTLNGGTIPLGATQLNSGGVSPPITIPAPSSSTETPTGP